MSWAIDKRKWVEDADKHYRKGQYAEALAIYRQIESDSSTFLMDEDELYFRIGFCLYNSPNYDDKQTSLKYFEEYMISGENYGEACYYSAKVHQIFHRFDQAIDYFERFRYTVRDDTITHPIVLRQILSGINHDISRCQYGKILMANPRDVVIENLGPTINTEYSEYAPVINSTETELVFTSRRPGSTGEKRSFDGDFYEDIYHSRILEGGLYSAQFQGAKGKSGYLSSVTPFKFSDPVIMEGGINTKGHEGAIQFGPNDQSLFIYREYKLWESQRLENIWQEPQLIPEFTAITDPKAFEPSITITPDGQVLIFSSDRKGGYGGLDLYRCLKQKDGSWSEPENLGQNINTQYDEDGPYLDPDGTTLYFSSKGHSSMGGYDVFKTRFTGKEWEDPSNMGYPVNSAGEDIFFVMTPDFNRGYYSSNKHGGYGKQDLYRLTFPDERPPLAEIRGLITRGDSAAPEAKITVIDKKSNDLVGTFYADSLGQYLLLFAHGKSYEVKVETPGFLPYVHDFDIPKQVYYYQFYQEIHHIQIKDAKGNVIGEKVTVSNPVVEMDTTPTPPPLPKLTVLAVNTVEEQISSDSLPQPKVNAREVNAFALALLARDSAALQLLDAKGNLGIAQVDSFALALLARDSLTMDELVANWRDVEPGLIKSFAHEYLQKDEARLDLIANNYAGMELPAIEEYVRPKKEEEPVEEEKSTPTQVEEVEVIFYVSQDSVRKIIQQDTTVNIEVTNNTTLAFFEPALTGEDLNPDSIDRTDMKQYVRHKIEPIPVPEVPEIDMIDMPLPALEDTVGVPVQTKAVQSTKPAKTKLSLFAMLDTLDHQEQRKTQALVENLDSLKKQRDVVVVEEETQIDTSKDLTEAIAGISKMIVLFEYESRTMSDAFKSKLDKVVALMLQYPALNLGVVGHTDSKGGSGTNQRISEERANAVARYLMAKGVDKSRLEIRGKGEDQPIAKNQFPDGSDNPEGRALNRRVEFVPLVRD